jgi:BASS family bile acid:Na+ symporter
VAISSILAMAATALLAALGWLGRQSTRAVAALVFIGIVVPWLGNVLKPFVTEAVFVLLCIAFVRVETAALRAYLRRPMIVVSATAWTTLAVPLMFGAACALFGRDAIHPELFLALMLQALASPVMSSPAFAALMGLDATLVLVTLVTSTAVTPLTAPVLAAALGLELTLSPLALGVRLFAILAGSALVALLVRRLVGLAAVVRRRDEIDGLNILVLFVFVAAVMADVGPWLLAAPLIVAGVTALTFAVFFAVLVLTAFCFAWAGRERALALALMISQRNVGLMLAATGGVLPDLAWLYFAVSQFPIYLAPALFRPIAQRLGDRTGTAE